MKNIHAVAKLSRPFSDFKFLCELDHAKGLDVGTAYQNKKGCTRFLSCLADTVRDETQEKLRDVRFFSLTCDGSMDVSGMEQESLYIRFSHKGAINNKFLGIGQAVSSTSEGMFDCIIDITGREKMDMSKFSVR